MRAESAALLRALNATNRCLERIEEIVGDNLSRNDGRGERPRRPTRLTVMKKRKP
jgi:hypothetical protein